MLQITFQSMMNITNYNIGQSNKTRNIVTTNNISIKTTIGTRIIPGLFPDYIDPETSPDPMNHRGRTRIYPLGTHLKKLTGNRHPGVEILVKQFLPGW